MALVWAVYARSPVLEGEASRCGFGAPVRWHLHSLGDVQVIPQKTRLVCVARVRFAGLSPRKDGFLATFALHRWLGSPRIVKTADYGPRWRGHHVLVRSQTDLDDELRCWLQESNDVVGLQADLLGRMKK